MMFYHGGIYIFLRFFFFVLFGDFKVKNVGPLSQQMES